MHQWHLMVFSLVLLTSACQQATSQCQLALDRLNECSAQYCADRSDRICTILNQGNEGSLLGDANPCSQMSADELLHLSQVDCDQLVNEATLLASGKADFPCPSYFPWCNALAPGNAAYRVNLISFAAERAELEVIIPDIGLAKTTHGGKTFHNLHLAGSGKLSDLGKPALPTVSFLLGVPAGTDAAWVEDFASLTGRQVSTMVPLPAQPAALEDAPAPTFEYDTTFYQSGARYPATDFAIGPVATWRNYRVVRITLHPVHYQPASQKIEVSSHMRVVVHFADDVAEAKDTIDQGETAMAGTYATTLVNYPEVHAADNYAGKTDDPNRVRYLIIANDSLVDALQPLLALKESQGIKTELVRLSEIGAEPEKIKARILQSYQATAIEYVLLVGDARSLPMGSYPPPPGSWGGETIPSDYWYGLLAGDDLLSEVAIGRIQARTPEEASIHIGKIVAYEKGDARAAWRRNVLMIAHEQEFPEKYTACQESIISRQYKSGQVPFERLYGGSRATTSQLIEQINRGVGIVAYRGHGSEEAWYEWNGENFGGANQQINNGDKTPVIFSIACLNAALTHDEPSNAEQWVLKPQGGAVAFLGATLPSWTAANDDFERHIFRTLLDDGVSAIGPLIDRARAALLVQSAYNQEATDNIRMYLWLGDPSLEIGNSFKRQQRVGWCNLQWPAKLSVSSGATSEPVFGQVWTEGFTESIGQADRVQAEVGLGPQGTLPSGEGWTWSPASYNIDKGNNDEYMAALPAVAAGTYSYAFRFKGADDSDWTFCDLNGSHNGVTASELGTATVNP